LQAHHGDLTVQASPAEQHFKSDSAVGIKGANPLSAGRILVIDDEPQIRRLMRTTLIGAGYEVEDARTGEEGIDKVRSYHPDLVLLDINMPGMGGFLTCANTSGRQEYCHNHAHGAGFRGG